MTLKMRSAGKAVCPPKRGRLETTAFTRLELLVLVIVLGVLASTAWPGLVNQRHRYDRVACVNNLRRIGEGYQSWGNDHGGQTPLWTDRAAGGMRGFPSGLLPNPYFNYIFLSNQLGTPKILVCPADASKARNVAQIWAGLTADSLMVKRDNAVSYLVGFHAQAGQPNELLSADRNLQYDGFGSCSVGVNNINQINPSPNTRVAWTNAIHRDGGNVLLNDGRVAQTTTSGLKTLLGACSYNNGLIHVGPPLGPVEP